MFGALKRLFAKPVTGPREAAADLPPAPAAPDSGPAPTPARPEDSDSSRPSEKPPPQAEEPDQKVAAPAVAEPPSGPLGGETLRVPFSSILPLVPTEWHGRLGAADPLERARARDRLREIGNNRLDHTPWPPEKLPQEYSDYWASERPFSTTTPMVDGGETFMHFRTRVGLFIEEMVEQHRDQVVLAVCHGGVVEAAFDHIFNIGPWRRCEVWNHNTGITHFQYVGLPRRETWRLHYHNRTEHLAGVE